MEKTFRVAHLSDIHFRRRFPLSRWLHVKRMLRLRRPSAIIATGDFVEHPWPLMLILARREMLELGRELNAAILTIPGNHDVAFKGFLPVWPFTRLYAAIFSRSQDEWITKSFPTFEAFYSCGAAKRSVWRGWLYLKIFRRWLSFRLRSSGSASGFEVPQNNIPMRVVGFDSNRCLRLASGYVPENQINPFGSYANDLDYSENFADALLPRVALIHHHLVPIPYTRVDIGGVESFLVLRNAGTVLKELWNHDFDIALHGHRHYSSFARLSYRRTEDDPGRELAVLSAASPTTAEPEARSNSFHLLDFYANGRIRFREFKFGNEATSNDSAESSGAWTDALTFHAVKVRNYRRISKLMKYSCDELTREMSINTAGRSRERLIYDNLRVLAGGELRDRHLKMTTDRGSIGDCPFRELREEGLWPARCHLSLNQRIPDDQRSAEATVTFSPPMSEGQAVSFGIEYQTANNVAMSRWEIKTFPGTPDLTDLTQGGIAPSQEACASRVRFPLKRLRLRVQLPDTLLNAQPYLVCYSPANYPHLVRETRGDFQGDVLLPTGNPQWLVDPEMSEYEKQSVRQLKEDTWEVQIEYPLVGYRYELRWHVEDVREEIIDQRQAGETNAYRKLLAEYATHAYGTARAKISATSNKVRELLSRELLDPIYKLVPNHVTASETFRLCVFVFDPLTKDLVAVEEVVSGPAKPITDTLDTPFRVPYGEGVVGLAFKQCASISYFAPAVAESHGGVFNLFRMADAYNLKAMLGIPIFHPEAWSFAEKKREKHEEVTWADLPSVHQVIGVVTLASDSESSGLTAFQEGADAKGLLNEIEDLVSEKSSTLLRAVADIGLEIASR